MRYRFLPKIVQASVKIQIIIIIDILDRIDTTQIYTTFIKYLIFKYSDGCHHACGRRAFTSKYINKVSLLYNVNSRLIIQWENMKLCHFAINKSRFCSIQIKLTYFNQFNCFLSHIRFFSRNNFPKQLQNIYVTILVRFVLFGINVKLEKIVWNR